MRSAVIKEIPRRLLWEMGTARGGSHEALESPEGGQGQQLTSAAESRQDSADVNAVCL